MSICAPSFTIATTDNFVLAKGDAFFVPVNSEIITASGSVNYCVATPTIV